MTNNRKEEMECFDRFLSSNIYILGNLHHFPLFVHKMTKSCSPTQISLCHQHISYNKTKVAFTEKPINTQKIIQWEYAYRMYYHNTNHRVLHFFIHNLKIMVQLINITSQINTQTILQLFFPQINSKFYSQRKCTKYEQHGATNITTTYIQCHDSYKQPKLK